MPYKHSQRLNEPAPMWVSLALRRAAKQAKKMIWSALERSEKNGRSSLAADLAVDWHEIPRDMDRMATLIERGHHREVLKNLSSVSGRCHIYFPTGITEWLQGEGKHGWMPCDK